MKKALLKILPIVSIIFIILQFNFNSVNAATTDINNEKNLNFKRFTIEDGLSQATAEYMIQDSKGYIWIGTDDGLNRYNGSEFRVYRYREDLPDSITGNFIIGIAEDHKGNIWVATLVGLNKINTETDEVKTYVSGVDGCNLSNNNITEILVDSHGDLYVATVEGVNKYNEKTDNFERLYYSEKKEETLTSQVIYSIVEDINGDYWIGTDNGLNKVNKDTNEIIKYYADGKENSISDNFIYELYSDREGYLWVGTYDKGLNKIDLKSNEITQYLNNPKDNNSIAGNSVRYILRDSRGIIWIATNNGLSKFNEKENKFYTFKSKIYDLGSLISNDVICLMEDSSGTIWVGTVKGISMFNPENEFYNYRNDPFDENSISENMIYGIYEDNEGYLWVGTAHEGLNVIDRKSGNIKRIKNESIRSDDYLNNNVRDITGIDNEIWIATEKGLVKYDKNTEEFTNYIKDPNNSNSLISNDVKSLYIDDEGTLWIGTDLGVSTFDRKNTFKNITEEFKSEKVDLVWVSDIIKDKEGIVWFACGFDNGLVSFNTKTKEIKNYKNIENDSTSLSFNSVNVIAIDSKNNLWLGTRYGLNKFNREDETFERYTEEDGLSNNFISGILVDGEDNLWISTNYGISNFEVSKKKFFNFTVNDGLQCNEYNMFSSFKNSRGEMFFGGINGFTYFYPENIRKKVFSKEVTIDSIYNNDSEIKDVSDIYLDYKHNQIQFNFFFPYYLNTKKIEYAYKLEGVDENWIFSGDRNYANYTNLDSGNYEFKVIGRNSNGEWSMPTKVKFTVGLKPWKTPLAYFIYTVVAALIIYIIYDRVKLLNILIEQRTLELNIKLRENEELYFELIKNEKYKNNYFINLSHELRTPLNIIKSTQQLISSLNDSPEGIEKNKLAKYMDTIKRNSDRLLVLINNIIDTSKIETGSYILNIEEHNIIYHIEEVVLSMKDYIESKGLELIIDPEVEEKIIECDAMEIERCIINLIGNAVKFTPKGGNIEVRMYDLGTQVRISVKDTGIGIDKKFQETIFDRFGQAYNNNKSEEYGGSGLGLTLTKQLVSLHNGSITVNSEPGLGSEFIITLPTKQI